MPRSRAGSTGGLTACWKSFSNNLCVQYTILAIRWFPVVFICAVMCWGYYAYVIQLCIFTVPRWWETLLYLVPAHIILALFLWSYFKTIFQDVGKPPKPFYLPEEMVSELDDAVSAAQHRLILERFVRHNNLPVTMRGFDGSIRFCDKCQCVKPDRAHHCSICGHCVLKFDHHCPWVNTCVNYSNYKFFILFLGYAFVMCVFAALTDLQYFVGFWDWSPLNMNLQLNRASAADAGKFHILFLFFASGMFSISVSVLLFYHLWLTAKNRSTIESFRAPMFTYGPDKNGFNLGVRRNFLEVFGTNSMLRLLPVFTSLHDGCEYPVRVSDQAELEAANAQFQQKIHDWRQKRANEQSGQQPETGGSEEEDEILGRGLSVNGAAKTNTVNTNTNPELVLIQSLAAQHFVQQNGPRTRPTESVQFPTDPLALSCFIPGLRELLCAGGRAKFTQNADRNGGVRFGHDNRADFKLLQPADVPFIQDQTKIGSRIQADVGDGSFGVDQTDNLFALLQRNRAGRFRVQENGNLQVKAGDQFDILGDFLGIGDQTVVDIDKNTFGTRATRSKGVRGLLEEKETSVIDPLNFQFGTRKQTCILRICFDNVNNLSNQ